MTEQQAIAVFDSECWREWTPEQRVRFQLFEDRLCMPFSEYHKAIEEVLGRPVWTHEFASIDGLRKEFLGERAAPTMQEILDLIPEEKRIVIFSPEAKA